MIVKIADLILKFTGKEKWLKNKNLENFKYNITDEKIDWSFNFFEGDHNIKKGYIIREHYNRKTYKTDEGDLHIIRLSPSEKESFYVDNIDDKKETNIYFGENSSYLLPTKLLDLLSFEKVILKNNGLILHSSFIKYKDNAILFSGASGIGKSTQADLWNRFKNAKIVNGDRSILRYNGQWEVFGSPYSGSSGIFENDKANLNAIVFLEQANENIIEELTVIEKYKFILSQIIVNTWDKSFVEKAGELIENLIKSVCIIKLKCLPNEDAVEVLDKYLRERGEIYE